VKNGRTNTSLNKISKAEILKTADPILMILFLLRFIQCMPQHLLKPSHF